MTELDAAKEYYKHPLQVAAETLHMGFANTAQGMLRYLCVDQDIIERMTGEAAREHEPD